MTAHMIVMPVLVLVCDGADDCPNQHEIMTLDPKALRKDARRHGWSTRDKRHRMAPDLCRKHARGRR